MADHPEPPAYKLADGSEEQPERTAKVILFSGITKLDLPPDRVLDAAKGSLDGVLVLGYDNDGDFYAASSYADGGTVLWLLELCRKRLLSDT